MKLQDWTQLGWGDDGSNCWDGRDEGRHAQLVPESTAVAAPLLKYKPNPHLMDHTLPPLHYRSMAPKVGS